ncbi:unnamed protein product [Bursaphelenchus xylophilus]|uniref:(pine wood nematode) hypothetical protein n=1 Tax=Bursaphelenchus xylophilus TaxID=6326 RepID=A0A811M3N1_BURXY|nr:unnamed protein product [Bursaphelenchus xylophilus]CAG9129168.1 unnamed protein product [Bursaphelenchus xylophilus]
MSAAIWEFEPELLKQPNLEIIEYGLQDVGRFSSVRGLLIFRGFQKSHEFPPNLSKIRFFLAKIRRKRLQIRILPFYRAFHKYKLTFHLAPEFPPLSRVIETGALHLLLLHLRRLRFQIRAPCDGNSSLFSLLYFTNDANSRDSKDFRRVFEGFDVNGSGGFMSSNRPLNLFLNVLAAVLGFLAWFFGRLKDGVCFWNKSYRNEYRPVETRPVRLVLLRGFRQPDDPLLESASLLIRSGSVHSVPAITQFDENGDLDGTESLDRFHWNQKSLRGSRRLNQQMPKQTIINAHRTDMPGVALLEEPTTPQRLANFLSKPFRSNPLKRTKSVSKLERPAFIESIPNLHTSQDNMLYNGSRIPVNMPIDSYRNMHMPEFFGQSMKSSRSHESLLSFSGTNHVSDLKQPDLRIHPVHPSVLEVDNCFKVANSYYVCESPQERTRWLENMRRAINPHLDERRRTENSFQIWILEAKGIPQKRRYYCDLVLDSTLYAKTSTKTHSEHCFWGDFFDLKSLPPIRNAVINLYREQDPRKKKDHHTLIGQVTINIDQFKARQPLEKWFTVTTGQENTRSMLSKNSEPVAIRIKARYQTVDVLPLIVYNRLNNFVKLNYLCLCEHLESALGVKLKEDFATCLVKVLHRQRVVKDFLCDIIMAEVGQLDNDHLMFRGNSLATKSMEAYIKLVAADYLHNTLGKFVKSLVVNPPTCEVDPTKMSSNSTTALNANRKRLMDAVEQAWGCIVKSASIFPQQLREVFHALRRRLDEQGKGQLGDKLVSASIFLRFLCPAVLSPSLFGLVSEYPSEQAARNLTLIAKTLQTLANFTKFGGKESFMEFMNNFIIKETRPMHSFLVGISHPPLLNEKAITASNNDIDSEIDQGKELSCLHSYLEEHWTNELHEKASQIDENMGQLQAIIAEIDMCKTREYTPQSTFSSYSSRQSTSPPSDYENNVKPAPPPKRSQRQAAMNLNTVDDYVMGTAVTPESSSRSKSQQRFFYRDMSEGREGLAKRYSMPYHNIYDITPSARDGYHLYDEVSQDDLKADELTNVSLDPADDEATDSETEGHVDRRITPRKTRRKSYMTDMRIDMIDPESRRLGLPSSGYQSQNQSCYSSSSNSPNDTFGKEKSHGDSQKYSNYLKDNLSYHTATTTSCSSTSSGHNDVEDKRPYQLSRSQTGHERIPYTKTRSNYRARSVVAQLPDQEPRLSNSTSCQSINGRVAIKDEDLSLIETQKRQIDELLRENENLKRALAEHHGSHVELTARPIPNQPFSVQLSPF